MLKISQGQVVKHEDLCNRFKVEVDLGAYEAVLAEDADEIGAWYGRIYIVISPYGESRS